MILTCTCRLSGFTRLIPTCQSDTAERIATLFFTGLIGLSWPPALIISDRDKIWTSAFWNALVKRLGTEFHMSTAFHRQADGCSQQTNHTVGQILRTLTSKRQGKWLESLPAVEYTINISTGKSPLELILGWVPRLFNAVADDSPLPLLDKWIALREDTWASARDALWSSQVQQALHHNRLCKPSEPLRPGSWALLDSADWRGKHTGGVNKLKEKFEGPYRVIESSNHGQNVKLDLPQGDHQYAVFKVSKVKPFVESMVEGGMMPSSRQQK